MILSKSVTDGVTAIRRPGRFATYLTITGSLVALLSSTLLPTGRPEKSHRRVRIGVDQAAPYQSWTPHGPTGFTVEVLRLAAAEAGIDLQWEFHPEGPAEAFRSGSVDLWPLWATKAIEERGLYFSRPWLENQYAIVWLEDRSAGHAPAPNWTGRTIAVANLPLARALARRTLPQSVEMIRPDRTLVLQTLCRGAAEGAFLEIRLLEGLLLKRPPGCETVALRVEVIPDLVLRMSIAAQWEFRQTADELREGVENLSRNGTFNRLIDRWFVFSNVEARSMAEVQREQRLSTYAIGTLAVVLGLLAWALLLYRRSRLASQAAERASLAKSQFLANVSHDVRTPMNGILGMADVLLRTALSDDQREYVSCIRESGSLQLAILNDLLDSAKIESGKLTLEALAFSPTDVLEQVRLSFSQAARDRNVLLSLNAGGLPEAAVGDPLRLRQVLSNLVSNAVKFTQSGTISIDVQAVRRDATVILNFGVRDTGIGIEKSQQAHIFEKFAQADGSTTRRFGGTGLGLSICRELVQLMGGNLQLESAPGAGSRFWFELTLPIAESGPERTITHHEEQRFQSALPVLVVEDNRINQKVAVALLRGLGLEVELAVNGAEAVEKCAASDYALVLMDCQMPVMDGFEATRRICMLDRPQAPIIACTAGVSTAERHLALDAGMSDFISKPIQRSELVRVLRDRLAHSHALDQTLGSVRK